MRNHVPNRTQACEAIVSDASCLELYLKACQRFPELRWILTEMDMRKVQAAPSLDEGPRVSDASAAR